MAAKNSKSQRDAHRIVPNAWVSAIIRNYSDLTELAVVGRRGKRGPFRPISRFPMQDILADGEDPNEYDIAASASEMGQHAYDLAYEWRDGEGVVCDVRLIGHGASGELFSVREGGRLDDNDSSNIPRDDTGSGEDSDGMDMGVHTSYQRVIKNQHRWYIEAMTQAHNILMDGREVFRESQLVKAAEAEAIGKAAQAQHIGDAIREAFGHLAGPLTAWTQAQYHESVTKRRRPPKDDPVEEAWLVWVETLDPPTYAALLRALPDSARGQVSALLESADAVGRDQLLGLLAPLSDGDEGRRMLSDVRAALPGASRDAFDRLAAVLQAARAAA